MTAENSVGRGNEREHEFYTRQGGDYSPVNHVTIIIINLLCCLSAPIGSPTNISQRGLTRMSAQISWDPPPVDERRGFIVNYTVTVTYSENGQTRSRSYVTPERSVNVTGEPKIALDHHVGMTSFD